MRSPGSTRVLAFVRDLMDRSKIEAAFDEVVFASTLGDANGAEVVVVDLATHADLVRPLRDMLPQARIVCYGRHTDVEALQQAVDDGADAAVPRSRFFADPRDSVHG